MCLSWLITWEKRILAKLVSFLSPQPRLENPEFSGFYRQSPAKKKKVAGVTWFDVFPTPEYFSCTWNEAIDFW